MTKISFGKMLSPLSKTHTAFTLIELIVSITILSFIMLSVFEIYSNIIQINKRLEATMILQENIRNVTEQIANDVREKGINFDYYDSSTPERVNSYADNGNNILAIQGGNKYYLMKNSMSGPILCTESEKNNPNIHCYIGKEDSTGTRKALSDDRVNIENIRFFLSGETGSSISSLSEEGKVTIVLSLGIEKKTGMSSDIIKNTHMFIETTISEKVYKKNMNSL